VVAINAIHLDDHPGFSYDELWWERSLRSVANVTPRDIREYLSLAARLQLQAPYECLPMEGANVGLRRIQAGDVNGSFVLVPDQLSGD
jgi:propanol-preferring alcohol dehydrogenase